MYHARYFKYHCNQLNYDELFCQHIFLNVIRWIQPLWCFYETALDLVSID